jgi:hypothetical protein
MSNFLAVKRQTYVAQRHASLGAAVTLVSGCGEYTASFECAQKVAAVLGDRALENADSVPLYHIAVEDLNSALLKLQKAYSVALVDLSCAENGTKFVPLWRIESSAVTVADGWRDLL